VRKEIFWHCWGKHGIHSQAKPLLHCSAECTEALLALPNDNEFLNGNVLLVQFSARNFASRRTNPIHWRYASRRTAGFEPAKHGELNPIEQNCTVKTGEFTRLPRASCSRHTLWNILVHRCVLTIHRLCEYLGTLQAYFTIPATVFHGKKAANSYWSPQFNCFFSFSMTNFLKASGPRTSAIGPKERILITISGSSSCAYLIFTR